MKMVRCPNCSQKTSVDYCQWCKYPILGGSPVRAHQIEKNIQRQHEPEPASSITCRDHPDEPAEFECAGCRRLFCSQCVKEISGKYYCDICRWRLPVGMKRFLIKHEKTLVTIFIVLIFILIIIFYILNIIFKWGADFYGVP